MKRAQKLIDHLRSMERMCLEQARLCLLNESRDALLSLANNYRDAAEKLESGQRS
jgi:hypothetical protein